ncbi:MAG: hypothetical protein ACLUW6_02890 [Coriobacteriaceae bacterium]
MGNSPHLGLSVLMLLEVGNAGEQLFAAALGAGGLPNATGDDGPNADHQYTSRINAMTA